MDNINNLAEGSNINNSNIKLQDAGGHLYRVSTTTLKEEITKDIPISANNFTDVLKAKLDGLNPNEGGKCTVIATLIANNDTTIAGGSFTPPITSEPLDVVCFLAGVKQNVGAISYALNGNVYDITINSTEQIVGVKINVLI